MLADRRRRKNCGLRTRSFASFQEDGYAALEMFELYRGTPAGHRLSRMNFPTAKRLATL
jgi:hypothetical protein